MALKGFGTDSSSVFQVGAHFEALDGNILVAALRSMGFVFSEILTFTDFSELRFPDTTLFWVT